nr:MAG TPA: hypothetical protein [Caudoviricetes sp.]
MFLQHFPEVYDISAPFLPLFFEKTSSKRLTFSVYRDII